MSTPDTQNLESTKQDTPDVTIGIRLKLLREQKGLSIQELTAETNISSSNLEAIEEENFDQLPADTFVRGLVNIYGNYLGLDGGEMARLFLEERNQKKTRGKKNRVVKQTDSLTPKKLAEPSHISSATVAGILLLLIVVTVTTFCLYTGWTPFAYFFDQGQQQSTSPLKDGDVPLSGNDQAAIENLPETPSTKSIRLLDNATTEPANASVDSSSVKQEDKIILNTQLPPSNH